MKELQKKDTSGRSAKEVLADNLEGIVSQSVFYDETLRQDVWCLIVSFNVHGHLDTEKAVDMGLRLGITLGTLAHDLCILGE
jgi:hypothetical protein